MTRLPAFCVLLAFVFAGPQARGEDTYLLQEEVVTDWLPSLSAGRFEIESRHEKRALELARGKRAYLVTRLRAQGGTVVWKNTSPLALRSGDFRIADTNRTRARLVRRRARIDIVFRCSALLEASPFDKAKLLSPRSRVKVKLIATPKDSSLPPGLPSARATNRWLTLAELELLENDPAAFRKTAAGVLLASAWTSLEEDYAVESLEARAILDLARLHGVDGESLQAGRSTLSAKETDLVLGRSRGFGDTLAKIAGLGSELPSLDADATKLLRAASKAAYATGSDATWVQLARIRTMNPDLWGAEDRAFLGRFGASSWSKPTPVRGAAAVLGNLGAER